MKTIVLATDGSPSALLATKEAFELASATGWPLHVVTVWNIPISPGYGYPALPPPLEVIKAERQHATDVAEDTVARARDAGLEATYELREGIAAEEICDAAANVAAKLIVLGAHGWGPVKRVLFGSVSTRVLHDAGCPVLVVRAEEAAGASKETHQVAAGVGS